ncbi:unnamed protein product, partial [Brenthis ino]
MSETPSKKTDNSVQFIPKEITSPIKDGLGISKTAYTHISNLHSLLSDWTRIRDKSVKICKSLSALKLHDCEDNYYPHQTKQLIEDLLEAFDSLENIAGGVNIICTQMKALSKLQPTNQPMINTWSASEIAHCIIDINESLQKELRLKQIITENIAHCRDENLTEVYVSAWEFEAYFNMETNAYLFAEVGLSGIT